MQEIRIPRRMDQEKRFEWKHPYLVHGNVPRDIPRDHTIHYWHVSCPFILVIDGYDGIMVRVDIMLYVGFVCVCFIGR